MFIQTNFNSRTPGGGIGCLIFGVLGLIVAYYILKGLFSLLWWAAPVLFLLTLLINWRVVADAGKSLINLFRRQPLTGLIVAVLATVAFPMLALFLFLSAVGSRGKTGRQSPFGEGPAAAQPVGEKAAPEGEFIDFEELESEPLNPIAPKEPLEKEPKKPANPYEDLFNG